MKKISVHFDFELNMINELEINEDYIRELLCECIGNMFPLWNEIPMGVKTKTLYALHNALACADRSNITVDDITIEHERKDEIAAKIEELKTNNTKQIFIIKTIREEFDLDLKTAVHIVRPYFPQ